ncbi:uncharacterized protein ACR2FA_008744 isoform 1-T1 [Aphomia sociella]
MSQKVSTRKGVTDDKDKEKRQTDSPVKEMKKKVAANAEKEKQSAEKTEKPAEKNAEKSNDKGEKNVDKADKKTEKNVDKADKKTEKSVDKADKKTEKTAEKKTEAPEKPKEDSSKGEKSGKDKPEDKKDTRKQNGKEVHNGVSDVTLSTNGNDEALNGTVSESDDDEMLVIDDHEQDELFPELTYDDTSDVECFEPPTPENAPSRSLTRRSQAKATRTPETPRPTSDRQPELGAAADDSKDSKVLKMKDDALTTDRKLRSADSPKPDGKKTQEKSQDGPKQTQESPKKQDKQDAKKSQENESKQEGDKTEKESDKSEKVEVEIVVEVEGAEDEPRKLDTNFSKSRVKVSPYRRSMRGADHTASSVMANYTGNNTTMEMDITESSSFVSEDVSLDDSYLSGLRSIRGRRSYKPLKEMTMRNIANRSARSVASLNSSEQPSRPTGTVVGRKRKPDSSEIELGEEAAEAALGKRMRLLDRIAQPFRRTLASTPLPARRAAEIVGINTDLPLSAPVSSCDTFDPESLKPAASTPWRPPTWAPTQAPTRAPTRSPPPHRRYTNPNGTRRGVSLCK